MATILPLLLDVVIAGLLIATITYAIILNRQLVQLRDSRGEMEALVRSFNESTARAEAGIKAMRRAAGEVGEDLQKNIERAQQLRDELHFMIEAADELATRLESAAARGRSGNAEAENARSAPPPPPPPQLTARRSEPPRRAAADPADEPAARSPRGEGGRRNRPVFDFPKDDPPPEPRPAREAREAREGLEGLSRAERELLEAMENRR